MLNSGALRIFVNISRNFLIYKIEDDKIKVDVRFDTQ